jgi:hypothetical protein
MKAQITLSRSKSLFSLALIWAIAIFLLAPIGAKASHVYLSLNNVAPWSVNHFCKLTVDTVFVCKLNGTTVSHWNTAIPPYNSGGDTIAIPNNYNSYDSIGGLTYYYTTNSMTIYILFDEQAVTPGITNQVFCGNNAVTLDALNPHVSGYLWSTGDTTQTTTVNTSGNYWVNVYSTCNLIPIHNAFTLEFIHPTPPLCAATYDPISGYNKLVWDGSDPKCVWAIIMKLSPSSVMENVDTVPFSMGMWIDVGSTPNDMARYALKVIDSCGNTSDSSINHITMWTTISHFGSEVDFNVTPYVGVEVNSITLNGQTASGAIDSIKSTAFYHTSLPDSVANHYVKFYFSFPISCGGAKSVIEVKSNVVQGVSGMPEYNQQDVGVYPNPTTDRITIDINRPMTKDDQIYVFNIYGSCVLTVKNTIGINLGSLPNGVYTVMIIGKKTNYVARVTKI